ncbi:hypothetical protein P4J10_14160 [Bacillus cereus]|uniref:hypothetical protein n=1 Tax=Bacillus thuringiensis TaxID=1428 RepID=UPI000B449A43|nr:hypothetical protein [Bacillus thuringiensis]MEB9467814.1 hypothetical protein [Bacillus cereus]OUA16699.1 hypothetical protein BK776_30625 [Bacillus thuringiensis serovar aizawai]
MLPKKYDKYDKVVVSEKELSKISKWFVDNFKQENGAFPLEKGIFHLEVEFNGINASTYTVFELHDTYILFDVYDAYQSPTVKFKAYNKDGTMKYKKISSFRVKDKLAQAEIDSRMPRTMEILTRNFMQTMYFMANFIDEKRVVQETTPQVQPTNLLMEKPVLNNKTSTRQIGRKVYKLKADRKTLHKRPYERHIDAWTRRGHFRYLKSGKRVWIAPTIVKAQGVENSDTKPSEYKL